MDCSLPGFSVHGILQARILEWVAISFSRGSSWPRDLTQVSCIAARLFTIWATGTHSFHLQFVFTHFTSLWTHSPFHINAPGSNNTLILPPAPVSSSHLPVPLTVLNALFPCTIVHIPRCFLGTNTFPQFPNVLPYPITFCTWNYWLLIVYVFESSTQVINGEGNFKNSFYLLSNRILGNSGQEEVLNSRERSPLSLAISIFLPVIEPLPSFLASWRKRGR